MNSESKLADFHKHMEFSYHTFSGIEITESCHSQNFSRQFFQKKAKKTKKDSGSHAPAPRYLVFRKLGQLLQVILDSLSDKARERIKNRDVQHQYYKHYPDACAFLISSG
jgi:hypothetical protein